MTALAERLEAYVTGVAKRSDDPSNARKDAILGLFEHSEALATEFTQAGVPCTSQDIDNWCCDQVGLVSLILYSADRTSRLLERQGDQMSAEDRRTAEEFLTGYAELVKQFTNGSS
jgi:hypothetical protein